MKRLLDVNIMVGRFQPFTNGHLKCAEYAMNKKGVPTVLAMIETKDEKTDERHPFPSSMLQPMYEDLFKSNNLVTDIVLVKSANIVVIGQELNKRGYNIVSWTCGSDRYDAYKKQGDKYAVEAMLDPNFEVLEIPRSDEDISATKARQALLDGDKKTFDRLTPLSDLKSRLKGKDNYSILKTQLEIVMNK